MAWSVLSFGRHSGKTLPQVIFADPDWFFWAEETGIFESRGETLRTEADEIGRRARAIRIPNNESQQRVAEYFIHGPTGKFSHMEIVPLDRPQHPGASVTFRKKYIDMSMARQIAPYDKLGNRSLIASVKHILLGKENARMNRKRCDDFFDNPANFVL